MKSTDKQVELLQAITDGKQIYNVSEARFYSRYSYDHPGYITLEYPTDMHINDPYFKATLTAAGRIHVQKLENITV